MIHGLTLHDLKVLGEILSKHLPSSSEVLVYGSRVKGTHTSRSDLDLVVKGAPNDRHLYGEILSELEDSDLPFVCEIQPYETIRNAALKEHIDRLGEPLPIPAS